MIDKRLFPTFAVTTCVIAASGLAGCPSNSEFVRFRNPFEGDLDRMGEEIAERRAAFAKTFGGSDESAEDDNYVMAAERGASAALAGELEPVSDQGSGWRRPGGRSSGESRPSTQPGLAGAEAELEDADAWQGDEGKEVTMAEVKRMRKTTGPVCYPCNGKGYDFKRSSTGGSMVACEVCGGTGRR